MNSTERQEKLRQFSQGYRELWDAVMQLPKEMWSYKNSESQWSVQEIIVHVVDSEANAFVRFRKAIAEPGRAVAGYDQDTWAKSLHYDDQNAEKLLELFKWLRTASYELLALLPDQIWSNTVIHPERGEITLDDLLTIYSSHISKHIAQIRRVSAAWEESRVR